MSVRTRGAYGFTLVELLVVIALIGLLIGIMLPSLASTRATARATRCLSQMQTLGQFTWLYADSNRDQLPRSQHSSFASGCKPWGYAFYEYLSGRPYEADDPGWLNALNGAYRCPLDRRRDRWSYGYNVYYELKTSETKGPTWRRAGLVPRPVSTVLFGELLPTTSADHAMAHFWTQYNAPPEIDPIRHSGTTGAVFLDGHAASVPFPRLFDRSLEIDDFNPATAR